MYKHITPTVIEQNMFNNQAMIKEFIALYRTQTPLDFQKLEIAVSTQSLQQIRDAAHHIKPTMDYIGALMLKKSLEEIETLAHEQNSINSIQKLFSELNVKFNELYLDLENYEKSL